MLSCIEVNKKHNKRSYYYYFSSNIMGETNDEVPDLCLSVPKSVDYNSTSGLDACSRSKAVSSKRFYLIGPV